MDTERHRSWHWVWLGTLGFFALAASTGVLYRFGIAYGMTLNFSLVNIRHAHSHLMYFGWVTPALMTLLWSQLGSPGEDEELQRWFSWLIGGMFIAAAAAYPLFLLYGYDPTVVGEARIPLAVIASTLNMVLWYGFVVLYARQRSRGGSPTTGTWFADAAVVFLVVSTFGAWGLGLLQPLEVHSAAWSSALTHIFLDLFSEGWLVLGVLSLLYGQLEPPASNLSRWSLRLVCVGAPLTFALGMPSALVPPAAAIMARFGGVLVGVGLLLSVLVLGRALLDRPSGRWLWGVPLVMLTMKSVGELSVGVLPGAWWASMQGLRILYLHVMLLGFVSLGLLAAAAATWGREAVRGARWFFVAVIALLVSLLPLTSVWPVALRGPWVFQLAAWVAILPVAAALGMLGRTLWARHMDARISVSS